MGYAPTMRHLLSALALLIVIAASACTGEEAQPAAAECEPGEFTVVDKVALGDHSFSLSFPCPEDEDTALATVIVFHGMPGDGRGVRVSSNMDHLAEEAGFMAVYPSDPERQWDAEGEGDDIAFVADLIDELVEHWHADADRIYAAGFSNGGDMTLAVGANLPDKVAAIAPVVPSGTGDVVGAIGRMSEPVPMVAFIGEKDTIASSEQALNPWIEHGECTSAGVTEEAEGYQAESLSCADGTPALMYTVDGGHEWFGSPEAPEPLWASQVIWDFFTGLE